MTNGEVPAGAGHAYEVGRSTLAHQMERIDGLDSKAGVIVAANGVLAGFLLSRDSRLAHSPRPLAIVLIVSVFLSMTMALLAFLQP